MSWALGLSLVVHAALLFIHLGAPAAVDRLVRDNGLEVILVNTQSDEKKPSKARAMAQTNLAGGGEMAQGRATSPLMNAKQTQSGQADDQRQSQLTKRELEQNELLAQTKRTLATLTAKQAQKQDPALERQRQEMLKMLAQIEKRIQEENARPRKRYISPSTQETSYALYYDQLRRKIEARGTLFFPQAQGQKLYGSLIMVITIGVSGKVVSADVTQSSGVQVRVRITTMDLIALDVHAQYLHTLDTTEPVNEAEEEDDVAAGPLHIAVDLSETATEEPQA